MKKRQKVTTEVSPLENAKHSMTTYTHEELRELGESIASESAVIADILYQLSESGPLAWVQHHGPNYKTIARFTGYAPGDEIEGWSPLYPLPIKESNDN